MIDKEIGYVISHEENHYAARTRRILAAMRSGSVRLFGGKIPPMEYLLRGHEGERRISATPLPLDEEIDVGAAGSAPSDPTPHERSLRNRYAPLTAWMDGGAPLLLMIDGAVESAIVARPYGVPTIIMREHGDRFDDLHLDLYDAAHSLVAPFPMLMEQEETPEWVRHKTIYCGGIVSVAQMLPRLSGAEACTLDAIYRGRDQGKRYVMVILDPRDAESEEAGAERVIATARHLPEWEWIVVGDAGNRSEILPPNVTTLDDARIAPAFMRAAQIVVAAPDPDTLAQIAFAGSRYICLPTDSPYNNQRRVAEMLERFEMAAVLDRWAPASAWPDLLRQTMRSPSGLTPLLDGGGARAVAEHLEKTAIDEGKRERGKREKGKRREEED